MSEAKHTLTSGNDISARAQLIKTRRGTWIDESLLPKARRECLELLKEAARSAVGEDVHLPGYISWVCESAHTTAEGVSSQLLWADFFESIGEKYAAQIAREEVEEAASGRKSITKKPIPKGKLDLITEKELSDFVLDELHRDGILDSIIRLSFARAPLEEFDAWELAREARKTARWCGCCGRELAPKVPAYFGARVYVGMWPLYWDRVSKPKLCKPDYQRTVLCETCAPEWLSPDRADVVTQLCAHCERPMVSRLKLSSLQRMFCSDSCRRAYDNQLRKEKRAAERKKVCEVCGEEFTARRGAKTCSDKCRKTASRRRKREVERER